MILNKRTVEDAIVAYLEAAAAIYGLRSSLPASIIAASNRDVEVGTAYISVSAEIEDVPETPLYYAQINVILITRMAITPDADRKTYTETLSVLMPPDPMIWRSQGIQQSSGVNYAGGATVESTEDTEGDTLADILSWRAGLVG
jgi:hypothetical protein